MRRPRLYFVCPPAGDPALHRVLRYVSLLQSADFSAHAVHLGRRPVVHGALRSLHVDAYQLACDPDRDCTVLPERYPHQRQLPPRCFPGKGIQLGEPPASVSSAPAAILALDRSSARRLELRWPRLEGRIEVLPARAADAAVLRAWRLLLARIQSWS